MPLTRAQILRSKLNKAGGPSNQQIRQRLSRIQKPSFQNPGRRAPRTPSPIPYSGAYESSMAGLNDQYNQTNLDIAGQRLNVEQRYGVTDTSNPYAEARRLEQDNRQRNLGDTTSFAARGQLFAGSLNNARDIERQRHGMAEDTMLRNRMAELAELDRAQRDASSAYNQNALDAEAERLESGLSIPPDPAEIRRRMRRHRPAPRPAGGGGGGGTRPRRRRR